jgi:type IV secretion system protein VirB9
MELRSTPSTYMASVSWQYPQDQLIALRRQNLRAGRGSAAGRDRRRHLEAQLPLSRIEGDVRPGGRCAPLTTAPGLHRVPARHRPGRDAAALRHRPYVVDRLFAAAELRLGDKDSERRVRIVRTDGRNTTRRTVLFSGGDNR